MEHGSRSILVLAGTFLAVLVILGLVVDGANIAVSYIRLERAAQIAASEAAAVFTAPSRMDDVESAAVKAIHRTSPNFKDTAVKVYTCSGDGAGDHIDSSLCTDSGNTQVRVVAVYHIDFTFLPILGIPSTEIQAKAEGETFSTIQPESSAVSATPCARC